MQAISKNFFDATEIYTIFHIQGQVSAGFTSIDYPGFNHVQLPNYSGDLGATYPDTGGQTAHVFEKMKYLALHDKHVLMFAMSSDPASTQPLIRPHMDNAVVVYLPFTLFHEAGILRESWVEAGEYKNKMRYLVPKETMMKHSEELFPLIAQAALDFLAMHFTQYHDATLILDANYVDAGQVVLKVKKRLKQQVASGKRHANAQAIAIWTPHTLGINKLHSLLQKSYEHSRYLINKAAEDAGIPLADMDFLIASPLLQQQENILHLIHQGSEPGVIAHQLRLLLADEAKAMQAFHFSLRESALPEESKQHILTHLEHESMGALCERYSFTERLTMEATEYLCAYDGLMAVSEEMFTQLERWTNGNVPLRFVRNGFSASVYNPSVLQGVDNASIFSSVKDMLGQAYQCDDLPDCPKTVDDETLQSTMFISVSRPDARKGSCLAIEAFTAWLKAHPEEKGGLLLVSHKPEEGGISDYHQELLNLIERLHQENPELHIARRIWMLPSFARHEIRTLLALPRIIGLAPSLNEPWGIVAVEMAGSGVPIIASDRYASAAHIAREQTGNNNSVLLFTSPVEGYSREDAIAEFVSHMHRISKDYAVYKEHSHATAAYVRRHFHWESMTQAYEEFYQLLLDVAPLRRQRKKAIILQDIDGTLVDNLLANRRKAHAAMPILKTQISAFKQLGGLSVLSTGRTLPLIQQDELLQGYPVDYAICSVGTEIYRHVNGEYILLDAYQQYLCEPRQGKYRFNPLVVRYRMETVMALSHYNIESQPDIMVSGARCSYYVKLAANQQAERLKDIIHDALRDMDHQIVLSHDPELGQLNLDIMPSRANKAGAARWLISHLESQFKRFDMVIVAGDSGNDTAAMDGMVYHHLGIMDVRFIAPANAHADLVEHLATSDHIAGVRVYSTHPPAPFHSPNGGAGGVSSALTEIIESLEQQQQRQKHHNYA